MQVPLGIDWVLNAQRAGVEGDDSESAQTEAKGALFSQETGGQRARGVEQVDSTTRQNIQTKETGRVHTGTCAHAESWRWHVPEHKEGGPF